MADGTVKITEAITDKKESVFTEEQLESIILKLADEKSKITSSLFNAKRQLQDLVNREQKQYIMIDFKIDYYKKALDLFYEE